MKHYNTIIIGGGAAGLFAGLKIGDALIIEHNKTVGRKIQISGGGKANFTNIYTESENFICENNHFVKSALSRYSPYEFLELMDKHNIEYYEKKLGQYFCKKSAKDLINMLIKECINNKCKIHTSEKVLEIKKENNLFVIISDRNTYSTNNCIIASGGLAIAPIGATDFGYRMAKNFGHKIIETVPSLVPYLLENSPYAQLAGTSIDTIIFNEKISFRENILFTHKGLSGPAILQISNYVEAGESFYINFLPEVASSFLQNSKIIKPTLKKYFTKKFVDFIYEKFDFFKDDHGNLSNADKKNIEAFLYRFEITPRKTAGYMKAEVTRGGVDTNNVSSKTMESKLSKGLYFIGEVLDVTGHLGGFNFQWAWASANAASQSILKDSNN